MKTAKGSVVIAGLFLNGTSVVRHLSALGYDVWAISFDRSEQGWYSSRGKKLLCPNPDVSHDDWLKFMLGLGERFSTPPALIPTSDIFVLAIDRAAEELGSKFLFHGFGSGLRTRLTSKRDTFELAERFSFPRPKSAFITNRDELADFAASVQGRKILIKPEFPASWKTGDAAAIAKNRKVMFGADVDSILREYDTISSYTPGVLAQEVIPGPDSNLLYWCGFVRPDQRVAGRLIGRKIRILPIHYGSASFVQLVDRPDIEDEIESFLASLRYQGLCGVELKEDPDDHAAKLIEINPRWGLWDDIGIPAGVDLADEAVSSLMGHAPPPARAKHFRQKWVALSWDIPAFFAYREEKLLDLRGWLRSLAPPIRINDIPVFSDFPYALHQMKTLFRKGKKKLTRS